MDELADKMAEILNNPEIMQQIKGLSGLLGNSDSKDSSNSKQECTKEQHSESSFDGLPPDTLNTFLKLAPMISSFNSEDKYTKFLFALRPLLSEPRQKKLDVASNLVKLIKIIPLLKQQGIF